MKGFYPYVPLLGNSVETGGELLGITDWIPASVPGAVQHDLHRAQVIPDPYYGLNSLACEWIENRWWMYRTRFDIDNDEGHQLFLHFGGLDYRVLIYLNKTLLGTHDNMFVPIAFPITDKVAAKNNELILLFEHAPDEMGQIGYTSKTSTQKSRFAYKWDFSTRMVPLGIWDSVYIKKTGNARIQDIDLKAEPNTGYRTGMMRISGDLELSCETDMDSLVRCRATIAFDNRLLKQQELMLRPSDSDPRFLIFSGELEIEELRIWYPNGLGEQPLYDVKIELFVNGRLSDEWRGSTGFRRLNWIKQQEAADDALPYVLEVNDQPVYIKGVNMTPLDLLYGTVSEARYRDMVLFMKAANVNLVRIWGGGVIEKEIFYQLCDQAGILVWQEFIQSSSGIDNVPAKSPDYLALLQRSAMAAIKTKRNHVSLACWSGGNELTDVKGVPVTNADENISLLKSLVDQYDAGRQFFPSSASGPNEFLQIEQTGLNHDVHGPWKYEGSVAHYKIFNQSDSMLHSEFGVDGCASVRTMKRFLPDADIRVTNMKDNLVWRHHGEWWDTLARDEQLFGPMADIETFSGASQWLQAEGLRYALEANRRRKFKNSGSIIWQLNEPFPNVSCTSVIDYYQTPKMAYYYMRKAYAPVHISMRYDQLAFSPGDIISADCFIHSSLSRRQSYRWRIRCLDLDGNALWEQQGQCLSEGNQTTHVAPVSHELKNEEIVLILLDVSAIDQPELTGQNLYVFSSASAYPLQGLINRKKTVLKTDISEIRDEAGYSLADKAWIAAGWRKFNCTVYNESKRIALFVEIRAPEGLLFCADNYESLPAETGRDYQFYWKGHSDDPKQCIEIVSW